MDGIRREAVGPGPGRRNRGCCPEELWRLKDRVPRARDELIHRHMGFARGIALRFRSHRETVEDVIQVSYLGLVNAVDRFDLERRVPFEAFAAPTIRGELLRHMRDNSLPVHVTRGLQTLALRADRARDELGARIKRTPTVEEVAAFLGEDPELVREALGVREATVPVSLAPEGGEGGFGQDRIGAIDDGYSRAETRLSIERAVAALTDDERVVLGLRFGGDLSQNEIAVQLGVSQMTVSRRLRRGLETLRCELEGGGDRRFDRQH